jgi:hypothetical protein
VEQLAMAGAEPDQDADLGLAAWGFDDAVGFEIVKRPRTPRPARPPATPAP